MSGLTKEQRDAIEASVDKTLMPLIRGVLVQKLSQVAEFMRDELLKDTRPQPAAQVAHPLTDAEIEAGRGDVFSINNPFCPCDSNSFRKAVQWAERKHGIAKGKP